MTKSWLFGALEQIRVFGRATECCENAKIQTGHRDFCIKEEAGIEKD